MCRFQREHMHYFYKLVKLTFFWSPSPVSTVYLLLPGPGSHHYHFQHLSGQQRTSQTHLRHAQILAQDFQAFSSYSPCIWTRNSVLILRAASLSFSLLEPQRESISSMKMMDGLCSRAKVNRFFTNLEGDRGRRHKRCLLSVYHIPSFSIMLRTGPHFSLSPNHLETRSEEEMEKKVELLASVATALARYDFPVPGGPNRRIPRQGVRFPTQIDTVLLNPNHFQEV